MRPVVAYTIVTVIVILLHIIRINNTNKHLPKDVVVIDDFVLQQYSPTCWYVRKQLLFKLNQCRQYDLGSRLQILGTVAEPSDNLPSNLYSIDVSEVKTVSSPSELPWYHPNLIQSRLFQIREVLQQRLLLVFPKTESALLFSVIFGGISYLPEELKQAIAHLGIQHIMAASGMQVILLLLVFQPLIKRLPRRPAWMLQVIILLVYAQLALLSVSILRAVLQSVVQSFLFTYKKQRLVGWTLLVVSILLVTTITIDSQLAFQLSFLAVIGLQFRSFVERALCRQRKRAKTKNTIGNEILAYIKEVLITSVYVQIWLFPFLCYYFGKVSSMSIIATLCVVWILTPLFVIGIPTVTALVILPAWFIQSPLVLGLCWPLHILLWSLNQFIRLMEVITIPPITVVFTTPYLLGWYLVLLLLFWWFDARWLASLRQSDLEIIRKKY